MHRNHTGFSIAILLMAYAIGATASTLYSNTDVDSAFAGFGVTGPGIILDEVLIPSTDFPVTVGSATFGIINESSAPITVPVYFSQMLDDGTPLQIIPVGTLSLTGAQGLQLATLGGRNALFSTTGNPNAFPSSYPGMSAFYLGLGLSPDLLWQVAGGSKANPDSFWIQNPPSQEGQANFGGEPVAAFYLSMDTVAVPEPAPFWMPILGMSILLGNAVRRKLKSRCKEI